jgi:hypothetical protein
MYSFFLVGSASFFMPQIHVDIIAMHIIASLSIAIDIIAAYGLQYNILFYFPSTDLYTRRQGF